MATIVIDAMIIVMLAVSVGYGMMVTRKLKVLMAAIVEMEPLVREFSAAVDKSETSVIRMKESLTDAAPEQQKAPEQPRRPVASPAPHERRAAQNRKDLVQSFFRETRLERGV